MSAVTAKDIALLHAYLVTPLAVNDAMSTGAPLDADTQYGLHCALSDLEPDSALLAIALSAQRIAIEFRHDIPVAAALKIESDKIVSDYASEWIANYHNHPIQGEDLFDLLCHVPEDLESLADLLESVQASIRDTNHPSFELCKILTVQARAQMDIAEYVLTELENEGLALEQNADNVCFAPSDTLFGAADESNIIRFPLLKRS